MKRFQAVSLCLSFLVVVPAVALGQIQDKGQQKCLNKVIGKARKVSSTIINDGAQCIKKGVAGKLPDGVDAQDCLTADLKGKVDKASTKVVEQDTKFCDPPSTPDFAFVDGTTAAQWHRTEALAFFFDHYGTDLAATLTANAGDDPGGRCTSGVAKKLRKISDTMNKEFDKCVKLGLKDESIASTANVETCLDAINTDAKDKVAKAVSKVEGTLGSGGCPDSSVASLFPGLDGVNEICDRYGLSLPLSVSDLAACIGLRVKCRVCRTANAAYGLERDCELFDDDSVDGSCPACANGVTDPGEECDDGNTADLDGCTADCILEFCGDGITNDSGTEECDDGDSNSDSEPDACRTDCTNPSCGDSVVDTGEDCDEGGIDTVTCDSDCTAVACGDGHENTPAGEECDDGNTVDTDACVDSCDDATCGDLHTWIGTEDCDGTECCDGSCVFETLGTSCTGIPTDCAEPTCDGAGTCEQTPANEGDPCDDLDECSTASECQSAACTGTSWVVTGPACQWLAVGSSLKNTKLVTGPAAILVGGDWCGVQADIAVTTTSGGDLITVGDDGGDPAVGITIGDGADYDAGDIVTNNVKVEAGEPGVDLPGLPGFDAVGAGQHLSKTPPPTFYDTTGTDSRIAECTAAQAGIATTATAIGLLTQTADLASAYLNVTSAPQPPAIVASVVGGLNVIDMVYLNGTASNVVIELDGGNNADTIMILRISRRFNTGPNWTFSLTGDLQADHVIFYMSYASDTGNCSIGQGNTGSGTVICPDQQMTINANSVWSGAMYGGASGGTGQLRVGDGATLTFDPFDVALP